MSLEIVGSTDGHPLAAVTLPQQATSPNPVLEYPDQEYDVENL